MCGVSVSPKISIVIATYNRSNVLRHTIASVLDSTITDWEMIVVGDACTDDTETVIRSFGDPRIEFMNLDTNWGEQSRPNNEGFARSCGAYVAFLNHDDLWLPDHLERCLEVIEREDADMVFSLLEIVNPDGTTRLTGASVSGRYNPFLDVPASTWLCRREFIEAVGGWPSFRETWVSPSQSVLFRGWQLGRKMVLVPELTVIAIQSGARSNSYADRHSEDHDIWAARISESNFRERELHRFATESCAREADCHIIRHLACAAKDLVKKTTLALGFHPMTLKNIIQYRRRSGFIDHLRRVRGLPPIGR